MALRATASMVTPATPQQVMELVLDLEPAQVHGRPRPACAARRPSGIRLIGQSESHRRSAVDAEKCLRRARALSVWSRHDDRDPTGSVKAAELGALAAMAAAVAGPMVSVFIWWSSRVESKIDALGRDVSEANWTN